MKQDMSIVLYLTVVESLAVVRVLEPQGPLSQVYISHESPRNATSQARKSLKSLYERRQRDCPLRNLEEASGKSARYDGPKPQPSASTKSSS